MPNEQMLSLGEILSFTERPSLLEEHRTPLRNSQASCVVGHFEKHMASAEKPPKGLDVIFGCIESWLSFYEFVRKLGCGV